MPAASVQFNEFVPDSSSEETALRDPGLLGRFLRAVHRAQTRRAEREIERLVEKRGCGPADDLARAIERHFV